MKRCNFNVGSGCKCSIDANMNVGRSLLINVVADFEHLPFNGRAFDVAVCSHIVSGACMYLVNK
jgi:hypothetical protein